MTYRVCDTNMRQKIYACKAPNDPLLPQTKPTRVPPPRLLIPARFACSGRTTRICIHNLYDINLKGCVLNIFVTFFLRSSRTNFSCANVHTLQFTNVSCVCLWGERWCGGGWLWVTTFHSVHAFLLSAIVQRSANATQRLYRQRLKFAF